MQIIQSFIQLTSPLIKTAMLEQVIQLKCNFIHHYTQSLKPLKALIRTMKEAE